MGLGVNPKRIYVDRGLTSDNGKELRPFAEAFLLIIVLPLAAAGLAQLAAASGSRSLVCSLRSRCT